MIVFWLMAVVGVACAVQFHMLSRRRAGSEVLRIPLRPWLRLVLLLGIAWLVFLGIDAASSVWIAVPASLFLGSICYTFWLFAQHGGVRVTSDGLTELGQSLPWSAVEAIEAQRWGVVVRSKNGALESVFLPRLLFAIDRRLVTTLRALWDEGKTGHTT